MVPPYTNTAGMFMRAMAMSAPGMFLSHPPTASTPSRHWALHTVSIESAITSRDTSEYFIPSVPIEMPSLTVIVPKVWAMAPAARAAASARSARSLSFALHGVIVLWALAIPMIGFAKSWSVNPTARSMARFGVRSTPAVIVRLLSVLMRSSPSPPPPGARRRRLPVPMVVAHDLRVLQDVPRQDGDAARVPTDQSLAD